MTTQKIDSVSISASPVVPEGFFSGANAGQDFLVRVKLDDQYNTAGIFTTQTKTFTDGLNKYFLKHIQDIELLSSVIYWQKRTIEYQGLHMAFLLDSVSEEDFEKEAVKFAVRQRDVPPEQIARVVGKLDSLIGLKLDTSDYADYFQCSQNNVMAVLSMLENPHFAAMLPAPVEIK